MMKKFLDIIENLHLMGNFNGVMEVSSGLSNAATFRLKQTLKAKLNSLTVLDENTL